MILVGNFTQSIKATEVKQINGIMSFSVIIRMFPGRSLFNFVIVQVHTNVYYYSKTSKNFPHQVYTFLSTNLPRQSFCCINFISVLWTQHNSDHDKMYTIETILLAPLYGIYLKL